MKRIIISLSIATLLLTACGASSEGETSASEFMETEVSVPASQETIQEAKNEETVQESTVTEESTGSEEALSSDGFHTGYPLYDEILDQIREALQGGPEAIPEEDPPLSIDFYHLSTDYDIPGYVLLDLDHNGTEELIVGYNTKAEEGTFPTVVYDMYSIQNDTLIHPLKGWARNRYYLCENGSFVNEGSSGAAYSSWVKYEFTGEALEASECIFTDDGNGPYADGLQSEYTWFYSQGEPYEDYSHGVTEEEGWSFIDGLQGGYRFLDLTRVIEGVSIDALTQLPSEVKEAFASEITRIMEETWEGAKEEDSEFTESEFYTYSGFYVNHIDDDDIPEIEIHLKLGNPMIGEYVCLSCQNGKVKSLRCDWCDIVSYVPRSNKILYHHGMHEPAIDMALTFTDALEYGVYDDEHYLWKCEYSTPGWKDGTSHAAEGENMEYYLNGEGISEKEYQEFLDKEYPGGYVYYYDSTFYTYDEVLASLH